MSTALVTDSTAYLPPDLLEGLAVHVVPLHVVVGGTEHAEGVDIDPAAVAAALRSFTPVSTSRPAPAAFLEAYRAAAAAGADAVVSVHISGDMSSTIGGAELAAEDSPVPVTVVDSRALGMAMGYAVLAGARLAAGGASADEVADAVRATCAASTVVFYVDTLEYLRRGGRIGKAGALLGSALSIKPILGLRDGHIVPLERVRTSTRAIARIEDLAVEAATALPARAVGVDVAVHHLDSPERAERLAERLRRAARRGRRRCGSSSSGPSWARTSGRARWPSPSCPGSAPALAGALTDGAVRRRGGRGRRGRLLPHRVDQPGVAGGPGARARPAQRPGPGTRARRTPGGCSGASGARWCSCSTCSRPTCPPSSCCARWAPCRRSSQGSPWCSGTCSPRSCAGGGARGWRARSAPCWPSSPWSGSGRVVVFALVKTVVPFVGEASVVTMGLVALVGLLAALGLVPFVEPVVGVWLVALAVLVLSRHRRNILAWWKRRLR